MGRRIPLRVRRLEVRASQALVTSAVLPRMQGAGVVRMMSLARGTVIQEEAEDNRASTEEIIPVVGISPRSFLGLMAKEPASSLWRGKISSRASTNKTFASTVTPNLRWQTTLRRPVSGCSIGPKIKSTCNMRMPSARTKSISSNSIRR